MPRRSVIVAVALVALAATVVFAIHRVRRTPERNLARCEANMLLILHAKSGLAFDRHLTNDVLVAEDELKKYFVAEHPDDVFVCPSGGKYTVGTVCQWPRCSVHGTFVVGDRGAGFVVPPKGTQSPPLR